MNAFNRGMGRADLERLVAEFNRSYTGTAVAALSCQPAMRSATTFTRWMCG